MAEETVEIIIEKTQTLDAMLHQVLNQALGPIRITPLVTL